MNTNVVGLRGALPPGVAHPPLVAELEMLLAEAKAGTIRGLAYAASASDVLETKTGAIYPAGHLFGLCAGILEVQFRLGRELSEQ